MTLSTQFYTMLAMIGMGSIFGASLDTYQRFLKRGRRKQFFVFLNDILFWVLQGFVIFYVLFLVNYGEIRFYLLLALLCGFAAYQALIKRIYLYMLERIIRFVKATISFIKRLFIILIYRPIKGIVLLLLSVLLFFGRVCLTLVKVTGTVLLWVLKVIGYPFLLIGKGLLYLIPESWKKLFQKVYKLLRQYIILFINFIRNPFKWK
ncbi:spore cortex biosynthesis protein YabQ [Bacillus niameyensis]|uniref:spore cortex biosynthesis protein YabQ n=1 Tax=Bacillus niameyensis TaxID=1522308 RepID=UPI0007847F54|nr:spore cortex biosynthesis protein YabQ [Bacillus niameyensis]